jgi:manganese transport protein
VLWLGSTKTVANLLGAVVAVLGVSFLSAAVALRPPIGALVSGSLVPSLPDGAGLLVLALIGTTVVPYNLFLGSGLKHSQQIGEMRFGLAVAVILGGLISMGILVVGTAMEGAFTYPALAAALEHRMGAAAPWLLGVGLFAAGTSSAITAPLAAAVTARSVLAMSGEPARWADHAPRYRLVWIAVLMTGVAFGIAEVQPIPAIIAAQALNGMVLPFVAVFLFIAVNDRSLMGHAELNRGFKNVVMAAVVFVTLVLGVTSIMRAAGGAFGLDLPSERVLLAMAGVLAAGIAVPVARTIARRRVL